MDLQGTHVAVVGGAGFIGSHTVDALISEGARVAIIDNVTTGRKENINDAAEFFDLNIADDRVGEIIASFKPQIVYHFAHFVRVPESTKNPLLDLDVVAGTIRILQAVKDLGLRKFVLASSGFLYGNNQNRPVKETEPIDPLSPYVVAKAAVENYIRFYNKAYALPYAIVRYPAVYGPRQVTGAMADYIRQLSHGRQAEMWGSGKTRDYLFIDDVVRANLAVLDLANDYPDPTFNVGTAIETTLEDLYDKIAAILGVDPKPIRYDDRPGEQVRYALDASKIREALGWTPRTSLDEGLRATIDYWRTTNFSL